MLALLLVAQAAAGDATPSTAPDPCGGIKVDRGRVVLGRPLVPGTWSTPEAAACVTEVARVLSSRRSLVQVSVVARVPDKDRLEGAAVVRAQELAALVVAGGLPGTRVSSVAPRAEANEKPEILLLVTERRDKPLARLDVVEGGLTVVDEEGKAVQAGRGALVLPRQVVRSAEVARAVVRLSDDGTMVLGPTTTVQVLGVTANAQGQRLARVVLSVGSVTLEVPPGSTWSVGVAEGSVEVSPGVARVSVRDGGGGHLECVRGDATATLPGGPRRVKGTQGAVWGADGSLSPALLLASPPAPRTPLFGPLADGRLTWSAVSTAGSYRVEVARDAAQWQDARTLDAAREEVVVEGLRAGTWFWRVSAVDKEGLVGMPSRSHAFVVP